MKSVSSKNALVLNWRSHTWNYCCATDVTRNWLSRTVSYNFSFIRTLHVQCGKQVITMWTIQVGRFLFAGTSVTVPIKLTEANGAYRTCRDTKTVSPTPNPQLEDQASVFMTPGDRVAQLYPRALGSSATSGVPLPVPTIVGPWGAKRRIAYSNNYNYMHDF
jgi:hypothetical protein